MAAVALMAVTLNARKFFEFQLNSAGDDFETTSIMEYPTYTVVSRRASEGFLEHGHKLMGCTVQGQTKRPSKGFESHTQLIPPSYQSVC